MQYSPVNVTDNVLRLASTAQKNKTGDVCIPNSVAKSTMVSYAEDTIYVRIYRNIKQIIQ